MQSLGNRAGVGVLLARARYPGGYPGAEAPTGDGRVRLRTSFPRAWRNRSHRIRPRTLEKRRGRQDPASLQSTGVGVGPSWGLGAQPACGWDLGGVGYREDAGRTHVPVTQRRPPCHPQPGLGLSCGARSPSLSCPKVRGATSQEREHLSSDQVPPESCLNDQSSTGCRQVTRLSCHHSRAWGLNGGHPGSWAQPRRKPRCSLPPAGAVSLQLWAPSAPTMPPAPTFPHGSHSSPLFPAPLRFSQPL